MLTILYALMHFLVDFLCAWAMFRHFQAGEGAYLNFLIYNFCAFALQMPLGACLDVARSGKKSKWYAAAWAGLGALVTALGTLTHPAVLGLGNALFHVGGGVDVTVSDFAKHRGGRDLGIFVAPGAIGLYLGTRLGKQEGSMLPLFAALVAMVVLFRLLWKNLPGTQEEPVPAKQQKGQLRCVAICCFAVVVLRSWIGFEVNFSWKSEALLGFLAVLAVASGKGLGGVLSAKFGPGRTMTGSLLLAAGCFLLGHTPVFGLAGLLLFNMSMPVTLYLLAGQMRELPGFSFGLLTFGLFLGFLPVYAELSVPISGVFIGCLGSIVSAVLLTAAWKAVNHDSVPA